MVIFCVCPSFEDLPLKYQAINLSFFYGWMQNWSRRLFLHGWEIGYVIDMFSWATKELWWWLSPTPSIFSSRPLGKWAEGETCSTSDWWNPIHLGGPSCLRKRTVREGHFSFWQKKLIWVPHPQRFVRCWNTLQFRHHSTWFDKIHVDTVLPSQMYYLKSKGMSFSPGADLLA